MLKYPWNVTLSIHITSSENILEKVKNRAVTYKCTVGEKKRTPLLIPIQIIVEKLNLYQSSWIIVYFNLMP